MNAFQKLGAAILIALLLLPVAILSGIRRCRSRIRAGRIALAHGHHD